MGLGEKPTFGSGCSDGKAHRPKRWAASAYHCPIVLGVQEESTRNSIGRGSMKEAQSIIVLAEVMKSMELGISDAGKVLREVEQDEDCA